MRILLINYAATTPSLGCNFRNNQLARIWAEMGHSVTLAGCSNAHQMANEIKFPGLVYETEEEGVRYVLLKAPKYQGSGLKRALNMLSCMGVMRLCEKQIVGAGGVDAVVAASVYQVDNFAARRVAKNYGAAFVRETRDVWPLTLIELSGMSPRHPFAMLIQSAENFGYRHADMVTTTLANSYGHMQAHGLDRERWIYLPQCPNPFQKQIEKPMPAEHAAALAEARAAGKLIIIFTGSLVLNADLETLLNAAKLVENERAAFFVIGRGPLESSLKEQAATLGLKNLRFLPPVERPHVPAMLRAADVATVGFLDRALYLHGVSPNKMFEYMENGLPIIFHCRTKGDPVSESGAGFVVEPQKPEAIAEAVRNMLKMPAEERKNLGAKGQAFVRERHDLRKVAAQYIRVFEEARAGKV